VRDYADVVTVGRGESFQFLSGFQDYWDLDSLCLDALDFQFLSGFQRSSRLPARRSRRRSYAFNSFPDSSLAKWRWSRERTVLFQFLSGFQAIF